MDYVAEAATLEEVMPLDMEEVLEGGATPLILDIREPYEFDWKLDCAAGTITKYRWYVKTERIRWLRQMQTSISPGKSGKINLNRKKLKQGLRNIFFCHIQDLIWYIDILFCILIHHSIPLWFIIVSLWNDISI